MTAQERAHLKALVDQRTRTLKLDGLCPICVENRVKEGRKYCGPECARNANNLGRPLSVLPAVGTWARTCPECGGQVPGNEGRPGAVKKFCSQACQRRANGRESNRRWYQRQKDKAA